MNKVIEHKSDNKNVFPPVHPQTNRQFRGTDLPDYKGTKGNESRFVRCKFCGSINDTELRPRGDGWGGNITYEDSGATVTTLKYPVVGGAGCNFCGSSEYY